MPMRRLLLMSLVLLAQSAHGAEPTPVAFEHAEIVAMHDESVLHDYTVLVQDRKIAALGPSSSTSMPKNALRIDARGKYLLPGFSDMHAHIVQSGSLADAAVRDELFLHLANGVTTVRNMAGAPWHLKIRQRVESGELLGPRVFTAGPILESHPSYKELLDLGPMYKLLETPKVAADEIRQEKSSGYDYVKLYNQIDPPVYETIMTTAKQVGLPVIGHVPIQPGLAAAFANHQASIEHLRGYDLELSPDPKSTKPEVRFAGWPKATDAQLDALARRTVEAGMWNDPTLLVLTTVDDTPAVRAMSVDYPYLPAHLYKDLEQSVLISIYSKEVAQLMRDGLPAQRRFVRKLVAAGAPLLTGTDAMAPGIGLHGEIRNLRSSGISNFEALKAATANPGRWFQTYSPRAERFGTIEVGSAADLILFDASPLESLDNLERIGGVMRRGQWFARSDLDRRLADIQSRNAPKINALKAAAAAKSPRPQTSH